MRIMLVTRVWPTQRPGGMPFVVRDRAVELARQGHEVHVITTAYSHKAGVRDIDNVCRHEDGVVVHYQGWAPAHEWSEEFADSCREWYEEIRPDILHSESFDRDRIWWAGLPMNITMHGFSWGAWLTKWNEYLAYGNVLPSFPAADIRKEIMALRNANVISVSQWEQRLLRDQCQIKSTLVYNPIAECFFSPLPATSKRDYFLCAAISQPGVRGFRMAQRAARMAGVRLLTVKDVSREEMPAIYDGARALVLPTAFCQGFDLSVAEARARGVPAIMSATGSYLDEARWWDRLVPIGDVAAVAHEMMDFRCPDGISMAADAHKPDKHVMEWVSAVIPAQ